MHAATVSFALVGRYGTAALVLALATACGAVEPAGRGDGGAGGMAANAMGGAGGAAAGDSSDGAAATVGTAGVGGGAGAAGAAGGSAGGTGTGGMEACADTVNASAQGFALGVTCSGDAAATAGCHAACELEGARFVGCVVGSPYADRCYARCSDCP